MKYAIINGKKSEYSIIIPSESTAVEQTAAKELKAYLKKAFNIEFCIKTENEASGKAFYVGHTDYACRAGVKGKSKENWIVKMHNDNIILTGGLKNTDRGIVYAVYHFLEDVIGVRWWTRFEEDVPKLSELSLKSDFCIEGTPYFTYRKILSHYNSPDFYFEARRRGNVIMPVSDLPEGVHDKSVKSLGGALHMGRPNHVHSLGYYFPAKEYFEKHPDWFAWSEFEQKRVTYGHYCMTNEEYIEAITQKLLGYIKEDQQIAKEKGVEPPVFYSVSFPDSESGFCQCPKCRAVFEKSGASGYALQFVNKLARAVGKEYPDVKLETLIYSVYLDKPKDNTMPEKNVIIRLAQVYADIIHGIHHKCNKWYLDLLKEWSDICKMAGCDLYIWEYMYQLYFDVPAPVANRLSDTFRAFADYGVMGVFVESQCYSADFWELNIYLLNHLNENPYADTDKLIDDFMDRFYGNAAQYVKEYYDELVRSSLENPRPVYCVIESAHFNYLDLRAFKNGMSLLNKALDAVSDNPVIWSRVRYLLTLLSASLVIKFYDLKRYAKKNGESFDFERQEVCNIAIEGYKEILNRKNKPRPDLNGRFENFIKYFSNLPMEEDIASLPKELSGVNPDDVYQFFFKNTCRHLSLNHMYGFSVADDSEAATGKTGKLCKDDTTVELEIVNLAVTSKSAVGAKGISIVIKQNDKSVCAVKLFKEDIVPDKYHLYKIGSVSGIKDAGDTRVDMFGGNFEWISLGGISTLFPMDECEVYLSIKFDGQMYGGSKDRQEAVYIDRAIIVRKK